MSKMRSMIIPDNETAVDLLYYEAIAGTIVELLKQSGDKPLTVGVHGDWGAGKSSILMMLEQAFAGEDDTLCIRFNGWLFQGFEDTKAVLIETIVDELLRNRPQTDGLKEKAAKVLKRVDWMKLARQLGGLTVTATTGMRTVEQAKDILAAAKGLCGQEGALSMGALAGFVSDAGSMLKADTPDTIPTHIHAFRDEFRDLLEAANIKWLVVVVDDLDRCLPSTALETLEAIRLFLFVPGAAFVIAADETMIEYAVTQHFPNLPADSGAMSYARNYLEKLIQVPFRLPPLGYVETRTYITLLNASLHLGEDHPVFRNLIEIARDVLREPWVGEGFDRSLLVEKFGEIPPEVESALQLADQIAPLLTDGARGNPRQIKRFLNTMHLRLTIASQRGIESAINKAVLAKLMLAERFEPRFFEQVEREATATGKSPTIQMLETHAHPTGNHMVKGAGKKSKGDRWTKAIKLNQTEDSSQDEWKKNEWANRWARLDPPLSSQDIRPYLFISRDRKSVFTATSTLSLIQEWVEKLCGSKMGAKFVSKEICKQPDSVIEQVFNAVVRTIQSAPDFKRQPSGIDGLAELCKVYPSLQSRTVSMLSELPTDKIGPWAVIGWDDSITETKPKNNLDRLIHDWADQDTNTPLQMAAILAIKQRPE